MKIKAFLFLVLATYQLTLLAEKPAYKNPTLSTEKRVSDLMKRMTLEEKVAQLQTSSRLRRPEQIPSIGFGCLTEVFNSYTPEEAAVKYNELQKVFVENTRLGIPVLYHGEAVFGLMANGTTAFPQPLAQAATFNLDLHRRMADAIAAEALSWGHRQLLSPTINVAYDSRWGRTHETYGEDPYLVSLMGLTYIQPLERAGIITTPKHFAANIGHNGQFGDAVYFSERFLREVEFPPFKTAVMEGKCRSIMPAYNAIDGVPCVSNKWLLKDILRDEWGFKGFVGSDYNAIYHLNSKHKVAGNMSEAALLAFKAGCDVEMPEIEAYQNLVQAVKDKKVSKKEIDASVRKILTFKFQLGLFENPYVNPLVAKQTCNSDKNRALSLEMAQQSMVLLKNEKQTLPFSKSIKSIAVLGPLGDKALLGNYAPWGIKTVSILDGIKNKVGSNTKVMVEKGVELTQLSLPTITSDYLSSVENGKTVKGLYAEYFNNKNLEGNPTVTRIDESIDFDWGEGVPHPFINGDNFSARWTGMLKSPVNGLYKMGVTVDDGVRLFIDDKLVIDLWQGGPERLVEVKFDFEKDRIYKIKLEYFDGTYKATARLGWNTLPNADIPKALEVAQSADAIVVVCGATDGEGKDRSDLDLTPSQEELITAVSALGKPFVVILSTGNVISMQDWADKAPAILEAWYPGQEGGTAVADILFGDINPSGKLPITFPRTTGQVPCYYFKSNVGASSSFQNGGNSPMFPFGHGLSYTKFEYKNLQLSKTSIMSSDSIKITLDVTNTGKVNGDEVVQLYIRDLAGSVVRPVKVLRKFERISINAGETKTVSFMLHTEDLSMWNKDMKWVVEPGTFEIQIGSSSEDIRLKKNFEVVK